MLVSEILAELGAGNQYKLLGERLPAGPRTPNADRAAGLKLLADRRRQGAAPAKLYDERGEAWGCAVLAIPELDHAVLLARNPDLKSKDRHTRNRAWFKLIRELGGQYGVDDSIGKRKTLHRGTIIK